LITLTKRADFQRASRAAHVAKAGFVVQMRKRKLDEPPNPEIIRIGFTCSKKVGNAVARNRAKRRLREVARLALPSHGLPGHDYVLIGRKGATAGLPFTQLQGDFLAALNILHGTKR
jgi:ribonuclease P protein component